MLECNLPIKVNIKLREGKIKKVELSSFMDFSIAFDSDQVSCQLKKHVLDWFSCYLKNRPFKRDLPLDFSNFTRFQIDVFQNLSSTQYGTTLSYQDLAKKSQSPKAYRAVGTACRKNLFPLFIPCHRVITSKGSIGNFAYGQDMKQRLLDFEKTNLL